MSIRIKRVYEKPVKSDGPRLLVDRLWPRGVTKERANISYWAKDFAPSSTLRSWFHKDPESRFGDFQKRYASELRKNKAKIRDGMRRYTGSFTLVTAVKDIEHSHIPTLKSFLNKL